jgi:hypothetical protein
MRQEERSLGRDQAELVHRWNHQRVRDPLGLDAGEEAGSLELGHDDDRRADVDHRRDGRDQAGDVARRHRERAAVVGPQAHASGEVQDRVDDVEVAQHRALRRSGRPRCVEDDGGVFLGDGDGTVQAALPRAELAQRERAGHGRRAVVDGDAPAQARQVAAVGDAIGALAVEDDGAGAALRQHPGHAGSLLANADRHRDRADALQREQDEEERRPVADQEGDAVALGDAELGQAGGNPRDLAVGRGVAPAALFADQRFVRRPLGDGAGEQVVQALRPFGEAADDPVTAERLAARRRNRVAEPMIRRHRRLAPMR